MVLLWYGKAQRNSHDIVQQLHDGTVACKGQQTNIGTVVWYLATSTPSMQWYSKHARDSKQAMGLTKRGEPL